MHVSLSILLSSVCVPNCGTDVLYGNPIPSSLKYLHTLPHIGYTSLDSHQLCRRLLLSPHSFQLFFVCRHFDGSHSDQHEMTPHCGFDLYSSDNV